MAEWSMAAHSKCAKRAKPASGVRIPFSPLKPASCGLFAYRKGFGASRESIIPLQPPEDGGRSPRNPLRRPSVSDQASESWLFALKGLLSEERLHLKPSLRSSLCSAERTTIPLHPQGTERRSSQTLCACGPLPFKWPRAATGLRSQPLLRLRFRAQIPPPALPDLPKTSAPCANQASLAPGEA